MDTSTRQIVRVGLAGNEGSPGGGRVLVGISAAPVAAQRDCLDFAVAEANRRHADLWLVHGCDPLVTATALVPISTLQKRVRSGRELIGAATDDVVGDLDPQLGITTEVAEVSGARALVDLSIRASLVVCQRRAVSAARRWHTGSTTSRVCAQSEAPVAVVTSWSGRLSGSGVVVGVDGHGHSAVAVETALVEARLRGQDLTAVHAWEAPGPLGTTGYAPPDDDELEMLGSSATHLLAGLMAGPVPTMTMSRSARWRSAVRRPRRCCTWAERPSCSSSADTPGTGWRPWVWGAWPVTFSTGRRAR
jgi:nucleotide-binding universal stress UspA family protein